MSLFGRFTGALFVNPVIRYRFLLPLVKMVRPNPDEEILELALHFTAHSKVKGDYLEFGVWKGRSFVRACNVHKYFFARHGALADMSFYAFDSFQGLPEIKNPVDAATGEFRKGDYVATLDDFKHNLRRNNVDPARVVIVPGWYDAVLNEATKRRLPLRRAAIIFIDCDLYESAVAVLNFVTEYVVDGTVIIFDDWYAFRGSPERGEQRAFREWLERHPSITATQWQKVNWKTNSFILHRTQ